MFCINGEWWIIVLVNKYDKALMRSDGSYTIGVTDDADKIIYIVDDLDRHTFKHVLIHEVTHAIMFSYNIYMDVEQEEILCEVVSNYAETILDITNSIINYLGEA